MKPFLFGIIFFLFPLFTYALEQPAYKEIEILKLSGAGGKTTRPFRVDGPWEIVWVADKGLFQIYLYTQDNKMVALLVNSLGGEGQSYHPTKGNYFIRINAFGSWAFNVIELK